MAMYFEENNRLFGFKGILGRRGFITNLFIILAINSFLFETPSTYYLFSHFGLFVDIAINKTSMPVWISTLSTISSVSTWILIYSSIVRRMRDIIGQINENKIYIHTLLIYAIVAFCLFNQNPALKSINFSIIIIFMCLEGTISKEKPKHPIIKFNWGAFIGTWIW